MSYNQYVSGAGYPQPGAPPQETAPPYPEPSGPAPLPYSAPQGGPNYPPSQGMPYPLPGGSAPGYSPYQQGPVTYPPSSVGPGYSSPVQPG